MDKSKFSISIFLSLLCLWSSTAAPDLTARVENLEETNLEQRREISALNETLEELTGVFSLVQNELESKAGRNETQILQMEFKDLRQEFSELKESRSKTLNPQNNIAHTTTCGGLVTVQNEHEIRYQAPSQQNRNESEQQFCIWIVENSQPQNLVLELKDVEREEDFQLWTISGFIPSGSRSQKIDVLEAKTSIPETYFALYFRISSPSMNNNNNNNEAISFNLSITTNTDSPVENEFLVNSIELSATPSSNLDPAHRFESFKYPLAPSTVYSPNERTFIILKPTEPGNSLRLKLNSVQTETGRDWIAIYAFSGRPISRDSLSGQLALEREFASGTDEPILVFFASDSIRQHRGFSFDYVEEQNEMEVFTTEIPVVTGTCGGFVSVDLVHEISYQVPPNETNSVCIWVVKNQMAGELQVELADQDQWTNDESSELFIIHSIKGNMSQKLPINIRDPSDNFSSEVDSYFLLYFRFNSNPNPNLNLEDENESQNNSSQGFRLLLQDISQEAPVNSLLVSHTELTPSSTPTEKKEFSYPVGSSQYQNNERAFIIIKPTAVGSKIQIDMTAISTEPKFDRVQIMSYSEQEEEMTLDSSFSGTFNPDSPITLTGRENEPLIILFSSDVSFVSSGFTFTYSEADI